MKSVLTHPALVAAIKRTGRVLAVAALAAAALGGPTASAAPTQYYGVTFYDGDRVQVRNTDGDGLNVRSGAGLGYNSQTVLAENIVVRVLDGPVWSNGYGWYKVTGYDSAGSTGWSAGAFLYRVSSGGNQAVTVARTQAPAQQQTVSRPAPVQQPVASGPSYEMLATAYNGAEFNSNGIMANGQRVYWGAVAVDPTVIPLGTRMYIEGYGNKVFVASDTGSAIKGYRIDIWYPSLQEARNFGSKQLTVTLIR